MLQGEFMPRATILNSRQTKTPVATDDWVAQTRVAVAHAAERNGWDVISSVGMFTWDLVTWQTARTGGTLDLLVPVAEDAREEEVKSAVIRDYALEAGRVRWHFMETPTADTTGKSWWPERDRRAVELADHILPVSVRPHGSLNRLLCSIACTGTIDRQFQVPHKPTPHHPRRLIDTERLNPAIHNWPRDYLIHWTRACHGPWPGETRASFFEDLVHSGNLYCRSALATLMRMLDERRIRASSWRIAGHQPVVAFTELSPIESIPIMRWRARWARWSFEPYGIAVHRDWASSRGVRPIRYVTEQEWRTVSPDDRPFCHRIGAKAGEWPAEREWRCLGDLVFSDAPRDVLRVIVRGVSDVAGVAPEFRPSVLALMAD
jgi:hypothetical protein